MRRVGKICCFLALPAVFLCFLSVRRLFPFPRGDALTERQQAWAGVLRLWVCEELPCGTLDAWLNEASAAFERRNDGVYVQITTVSRASAADFAAAENPPDMLLLPPSLLDTPDGLLNRSGEYLTPVAMGGYAWAVNRAKLPDLSPEGAPMRIPMDTETASYSAALAALLCGDEAASGDTRRESRYGVDLGLPDASPHPAETSAPLVRKELRPADGSQADENAFRGFTRGETAVTLVSSFCGFPRWRTPDARPISPWCARVAPSPTGWRCSPRSICRGTIFRRGRRCAKNSSRFCWTTRGRQS